MRQILDIIDIVTEEENLYHFLKTLSWRVKTERMVANLLLVIIISTQWKLFPIKMFMPVWNFHCLTTLLFYKRKPFLIFRKFRGLLKKLRIKFGDFSLKKGGEKRTRMVKVAKSCHQVTWEQNTWQKRESYSKSFNFKIFKCKQFSYINLICAFFGR